MANRGRKECLGFSPLRSRHQAEDDAEVLDQGTKRVLLKRMVLDMFLVFSDADTSESTTSGSETSGVFVDADTCESTTSGSETSDVFVDADTSENTTSANETSDVSPDADTSESTTSGSETSDVFPYADTIESTTSGSETSDVFVDADTSESTTSDSETSDVSPDADTIESTTSGSETSDVFVDADTSESTNRGSETSGVSPDADTSSQPVKWDQQEHQRITTDVATVTGTSQSMKKKEEKISKNLFHGNPGFMTSKGDEERVPMKRTNEEEALLIKRQWKEWMDEQEMRWKVKPVDQQNAEEQGGAAPPTPAKETNKKKVKGVGTLKKMKTYLRDLFNPRTSHKYERLEDED